MMYGPELSERILVNINLNKEQVDSKVNQLLELGCFRTVENLDILKVDFTFSIDYYYGVAKKLIALTDILSMPGVVAKVKQEELNRGKCVLQEFFESTQKFLGKLS